LNTILDTAKKWYVVYTKPRWEKKVTSLLGIKNVENYCPLNKVQKQWSDRKKVVLEPLFKGYVFVCVAENEKWEVAKINGILNYVYWLGKPAVVKESDIQSIKMFLNEFENVQISTLDSPIKISEKVIIKQGLLMNYKGIVLEVLGKSARVKIEELGVILSATIEQKNLEKII
jgi:transcription antitermination factor NusG